MVEDDELLLDEELSLELEELIVGKELSLLTTLLDCEELKLGNSLSTCDAIALEAADSEELVIVSLESILESNELEDNDEFSMAISDSSVWMELAALLILDVFKRELLTLLFGNGSFLTSEEIDELELRLSLLECFESVVTDDPPPPPHAESVIVKKHTQMHNERCLILISKNI